MGSVRMSNSIKENIVADVIKRRFQKEVQALHKRLVKHANNVFDATYPAAQRKQMDALPEGWLPTTNQIKAQMGLGGNSVYEFYLYGYFQGQPILNKLADVQDRNAFNRRIPYKMYSGYGVKHVFEQSDHIVEVHEALMSEAKALNDQIEKAKNQTLAALGTATTVGALIKRWPEIALIASKYDREVAERFVPSIRRDELNALLDLPPEEDEKVAA